MSSEFETGFMVREPSWHKLERAVLTESPRTWTEAREAAGLTWEVAAEPVYAKGWQVIDGVVDRDVSVEIRDWQAIVRDDKGFDDPDRLLSIQKTSYQVIHNAEFGEVIDAVLGLEQEEDPVVFEALFSLYGGKQVVALIRFENPLVMPWDDSKSYPFCSFATRNDGQGGLRGVPTVIRVVCSNTQNLSEMVDGRTTGFTIRHTSNWEARVKEIGAGMAQARGDSAKWLKFAEALALWKVTPRNRETYLKRYLPVADDMGTQQVTNVLVSRSKIRDILDSPTCTHVKSTGYGLLMASTEWSDHYRAHNNADSFVSRQLLRKEEPKARSSRILRQMAGVKI